MLPDRGGMETAIDNLARRFSARGHSVTVVAPHSHRDRDTDDSVYPYTVHRHEPFPRSGGEIRTFRRHLLEAHSRHGFDLVHCHGFYPQTYLAASCKPEMRIVCASTSHGSETSEERLAFYGEDAPRRTFWALRQMDALVALNRRHRKRLLELKGAEGRVVQIPNGIDVEAFRVPAPRPPDLGEAIHAGEYILYLGRLVGRKGVDVLLRALCRLPAGVRLLVAGDGKRRVALRRLADDLGLGTRVWFTGWVEGEAKSYLLQNALCVVSPSTGSEAFGLVPLEAAACGRPVVASRTAGLEERVEDGRTGLLVPPRSVSKLADAMRALLEDRDLARTMGKRARRLASDYDWSVVADTHLELYRDLLATA